MALLDSKDWSQYAEPQVFEPGEYLCKEGDPGNEMYVLGSGRVAIIKGAETSSPLILNYRGAGDMIGEIGLLQETTRTASIMAIEPTSVHIIHRDQFWEMIDEDPFFRRIIMSTLVDRLLAADDSRLQAADSERELIVRLSSISTDHEKLAELVQLRQETMRFIVHDLRNPLNLVIFALQMIEFEVENSMPDESRQKVTQYRSMAQGAVQRMLALVDAMLEVEKLEDGGLGLELEEVDLLKLAEETVENLQPMASTYYTNLTMRTPDEGIPPIVVDKHRVERVITNLVDNALKFTPAGGTVTVIMTREGDHVRVGINDTGPGIPQEKRDRVFDRFARIGEGGERPKGFGLGLAFCRSAVLAHGGEIFIEDGEGGVGSQFVFTLPYQQG